MVTCAFNRSSVLSNAFGCPASSGKNREAGENPARSRHCEDRRFGSGDAKARRPARTPFAAFERLAQGCSGRRGNSLLGKDPVASLSLPRGRKSDGILSFQLTLECADNGGALDSSTDPKWRRATLVAALQILSVAMLIGLGTSSCFDRQKKTSITETPPARLTRSVK